MVYHRKVLMSVAGLIWHQIEVKNDRNHPTLLGWFWSPNITQNSALYCIKFSQYNQQGSLITYCKFFNKYFTFPLKSTWGLEEDFSIFPTYSSYTDVTQNFEPLRWRRISPCHTNFKTHYSACVELSCRFSGPDFHIRNWLMNIRMSYNTMRCLDLCNLHGVTVARF